MEATKEVKIGSKISSWYAHNGRQNLPWRENVTPYRIWISEIMLQQTQVNTAIDYFNRFMAKYPDLEAIKDATEDDIYGLWSGLGYYQRASYIYRAKEIIHKEFLGKMPEKYEDFVFLPGIGKSTAGAILSIAFNKPYPILDANVKKVISRIFFQKDYPYHMDSSVVVTYVAGDTRVPSAIHEATTKLSAAEILRNDDQSILIAETGANITTKEKYDILRKEGMDTLKGKADIVYFLD